MNDVITRVQRLKILQSPDRESFHLKVHDNEAATQLEFEITDSAPSVESDGTVRRRMFSSKLNENENEPMVIQPVLRSHGTRHAIYQFPLTYEALFEGKNTFKIYEEGADTQKGAKRSGPTHLWTVTFLALAEKNEVHVKLERPDMEETPDKILWRAIKQNSLQYSEYEKFIDEILCRDPKEGIGHDFPRKEAKIRSPFVQSDEYNLIKFATDFFMLKKSGLKETELLGYVGSSGKLPYFDYVISRIRDEFYGRDLKDAPPGNNECAARTEERLFNPFMIELIWSYWMEQGMLDQTMNVINLRFQNKRTPVYSDRLQRFDVDPLRPLSYILWGSIQDEQHRLSLPRRVSEYDHEYGLRLLGRAVGRLDATDSRVKFLEAFHTLLNLSFIYFKESDDTTYIADAFPVLNALREVHLLLAEGNHNAYGNLTWTARQEMLMEQYILARPEMRDFLGGRVMVPYPETWMDRVDTMRNIQGWGQTSILHYYELAVHGEQVLLSIRYGNWSDVNLDRHNAANWAQEFRNNIFRYAHAYRVVTGVDLSAEKIQDPTVFAVQPSLLIQQRLLEEKGAGRLVQSQRLLITRNNRRGLSAGN